MKKLILICTVLITSQVFAADVSQVNKYIKSLNAFPNVEGSLHGKTAYQEDCRISYNWNDNQQLGLMLTVPGTDVMLNGGLWYDTNYKIDKNVTYEYRIKNDDTGFTDIDDGTLEFAGNKLKRITLGNGPFLFRKIETCSF